MPDFSFSQIFTANQRDVRPLANWKYRRLPFAALVTVISRSSTAGNLITADAGAQNIQQRSPVQGGGTIGTTPVPQTTPVLQFVAQPFDEIVLSYDETLGGTPTVDGYINIEPA